MRHLRQADPRCYRSRLRSAPVCRSRDSAADGWRRPARQHAADASGLQHREGLSTADWLRTRLAPCSKFQDRRAADEVVRDLPIVSAWRKKKGPVRRQPLRPEYPTRGTACRITSPIYGDFPLNATPIAPVPTGSAAFSRGIHERFTRFCDEGTRRHPLWTDITGVFSL